MDNTDLSDQAGCRAGSTPLPSPVRFARQFLTGYEDPVGSRRLQGVEALSLELGGQDPREGGLAARSSGGLSGALGEDLRSCQRQWGLGAFWG